ncbi:MAG: hypothetical protein OEL88_13985 [Sterolibacteriaceae bacterium MAG5]|nr:hypothetical protein [Candidatus Nitricoxidireducens bremensis]
MKKPPVVDRVDISSRGKTEVITLRLNAKVKFGLELAARMEHRSVAQTVELSIAKLLSGTSFVPLRYKGEEIAVVIDRLWSPHRGQRLLKMVLHAPELLNPDEELVWNRIARAGHLDAYFTDATESSRRPTFTADQTREVEDVISEFWDIDDRAGNTKLKGSKK